MIDKLAFDGLAPSSLCVSTQYLSYGKKM